MVPSLGSSYGECSGAISPLPSRFHDLG